MTDFSSNVGDAAERAIRTAKLKAAVVRALALWETWIVMASLAYLVAHLSFWAALGFRVVGR